MLITRDNSISDTFFPLLMRSIDCERRKVDVCYRKVFPAIQPALHGTPRASFCTCLTSHISLLNNPWLRNRIISFVRRNMFGGFGFTFASEGFHRSKAVIHLTTCGLVYGSETSITDRK